MNTVYIETSIVSYLRQKPSTQVVTAARQVLTHQWWNHERQNYDLVISQYVIDEASEGDATLAAEGLESLDGIPLLPNAPEIPQIASEIMSSGVLPANVMSRRTGSSTSKATGNAKARYGRRKMDGTRKLLNGLAN